MIRERVVEAKIGKTSEKWVTLSSIGIQLPHSFTDSPSNTCAHFLTHCFTYFPSFTLICLFFIVSFIPHFSSTHLLSRFTLPLFTTVSFHPSLITLSLPYFLAHRTPSPCWQLANVDNANVTILFFFYTRGILVKC